MQNVDPKKDTDELVQELMETGSIEDFLSDNESQFIPESFSSYITEMYKSCNLTKAEVARRSGVSEIYLHQLFAGRRKPSRDRAICVCIGMQASLEQTQTLLRHSELAQLYAKNRRDAIIMYGITNGYSLSQVNEELLSAKEEELK